MHHINACVIADMVELPVRLLFNIYVRILKSQIFVTVKHFQTWESFVPKTNFSPLLKC